MQNLGDDEKKDRVSKILRSMRGIDGLVKEISSPGLRRSIYTALRERFDLVQVEDASTDQMFFKVLTSASMKVLSLRDSDQNFSDTVGLIAEALRMSANTGPAVNAPMNKAPSPVPVASPVPSPASSLVKPHKGLEENTPNPAQKPYLIASSPAKVALTASAGMRLYSDLPAERKTERRLDPLTLLLPGPARNGTLSDVTEWVSGKPWAGDVLTLRFAPTDPAAIEEIADLEAEGFSAPKTLRDRPGLRPLLDTTGRERGISLLHGAGRDLGIYAVSNDQAMSSFKDAIERVIERHWPAHAPSLAAFGARLVPGEEVPGLLASAWDVETFFLRDSDEEDKKGPQDTRGCISPDRALLPGIVFERAAFLFVATGQCLSAALVESLVELRLAQTIRELEEDQIVKVQQAFDAIFFSDCARPIDDYKLHVGVMQAQPEPMPEF